MTPSEAIRLRLLGGLEVEGPGEDAASLLSQPKRLALLAYLAVQGGFVRREALVDMFWPESDPERARRALSQATHVLRRSLGRQAIRSRGIEELGISPEYVWIDVRAFEAAVAGARWEEAVELHRGELLHGLNGDPLTPEYSRWLDAERLRLQRAAAGAAKRLADAAFRSGDVASAIAWQRRAVDVRPFDEALVRDYLALLDEAGDAALALSAYDAFRTRLSTEYDLEPARETVRLIEMIRSRRPETTPAMPSSAGPQSAPAVGSGVGGAEPAVVAALAPATGEAVATAGVRARGGWRWSRPVVTAAGVFLAIAVLWLNRASPTDAAPTIVPNRVAVMYLQPLGDSMSVFIADGVTGALIDHLTEYASLEVLPSSAVMQYRGSSPGIDSLVAALKAAIFVTGNVRRIEDQTHVNVAVTGADGRTILNDELPFDGANTATISVAVTEWVVDGLRQIGEALEEREIRYGTTDSLAAILTMEGIQAERRAIEFGSSGLFDLVPGLFVRADSLLEVASRRDPSWLKPYLYRGRLAGSQVRFCYMPPVDCEWQPAFEKGIGYLTTVIERDSDNAEALETRANLRWMSWFYGVNTDTAVLNSAAADAQAAIGVSDLRPLAHSVLGSVYMERGRWADAFVHASWAFERDEFQLDKRRNLADLFEITFNMYRDSAALQYCNLLRAGRMPDARVVWCELQLRAWSDILDPEIAGSRSLVDEYLQPLPHEARAIIEPQVELLMAAVMARHSQNDKQRQDSVARAVGRIVDENPDADDALLYAAAVMARMNRIADARDYLEKYITAKPATRWHVSARRWFEKIDFDPGKLDPAELRPGRRR